MVRVEKPDERINQEKNQNEEKKQQQQNMHFLRLTKTVKCENGTAKCNQKNHLSTHHFMCEQAGFS